MAQRHIEPELLTMAEAQEALRLSRSTVYAEAVSGRLRSVRIGRARRIPREAIQEYIKLLEHEQETT